MGSSSPRFGGVNIKKYLKLPPPRYSLILPPKKNGSQNRCCFPAQLSRRWKRGPLEMATLRSRWQCQKQRPRATMAARAAWLFSWSPPGGGKPTTSVDWWQPEIRQTDSTSWGEGSEYPMIYEGFCTHARWLFGMFSINSSYKWS